MSNAVVLNLILTELRQLRKEVQNLTKKVDTIAMATGTLPQDILDLQAAVAQEKTVEDSAVTLLTSLSAQLTAALGSTNPTAAVNDVISTINANKTALAAAVVANTPAAPTTTPAPPAATPAPATAGK